MTSLSTSWKAIGLSILIAVSATQGAEAQGKKKKSSGKVPLPADSMPAPSKDTKKDEKGESAPANPDKVDISDIENKYWAPKDTDFSVVQNRTYTKEKRYSLSAQVGPLTNDQYAEGVALAFTGNYFLSERYGVQLSFIGGDFSNREVVDNFISQGGRPNYGQINNTMAAGFSWVPFYAKMSVLGQKIIYFDMAFTPTLGATNYTQFVSTGNKEDTAPTLGLDITQYFFFSKNFAVRFDYRNIWFAEKVLQFQADIGYPTGSKRKDKITNVNFLLLGATFFF